MAESPEAALRQLRERGIDADAGRRAPRARPDLPGLHRAPERGPAADHPGEAGRDRPPARPDRRRASSSRPSATQAIAAIAEEVETFWLSETDPVRPADRPRRGPPGLGLVENRLFDVVPRVYRQLEAALRRVYPGTDLARPLLPPVRLLDRRRPRRPPERHPRGHGRRGQAPAGDDPPPLPGPRRRPLAAAEPFRPLREARRPAFRDVAGARRRALPRAWPPRPSTSPTGPSAG